MRTLVGKRWGLTVALTLYVFAILVAAMLFAGFLVAVLSRLGIINAGYELANIGFVPVRFFINVMLFSAFIGIALSLFLSKWALEPLRNLVVATKKVATGDFSVMVEGKGIREFDELSDSFNQMTRELASIETMRSDFINNFSHEFKTPIVSIRGFAKLLLERELTDSEKQDYLQIIFTESERLSNLASSILNLTKYEATEIISEKKSFPLDEQLRKVILMTEPKWSAKEIEMDVDLQDVTFEGNPDLMQLIWINLIENAIKFTPNQGKITVSLRKTQSEIIMSVEDTGIGMDDETIKHAFDKFYQGDKSRRQSGNGLGLAIAKRITQLCGGRIDIRSTPGEGSIFIVSLP